MESEESTSNLDATSSSPVAKPTRTRDPTVFYEFVFDVGTPINPAEAVQRVLDSDLGLAAWLYPEGERRVASRFRNLERLIQDMRQLEDLMDRSEPVSAGSFMRWMARHPAWALKMLRKRRHSSAADEDDKRPEPSTTGQSNTDDGTKSTAQKMAETREWVEEQMIRLGLIENLRHHIDTGLYQPSYLDEGPFSVVSCQSFFMSIGDRKIDGDVGLLIHRSGVAVLTFYAPIPGELSADEVGEFLRPSSLRTNSMKSVREIWEARVRNGRLAWSDLDVERDFSGGVDWVQFSELETETLTDFFIVYAETLIRTIRGSSPRTDPWQLTMGDGWHLYPIVFVKEIDPPCFDPADLASRASFVLPILLRDPSWRNFRDELLGELAAADTSIVRDSAVYPGSGHTAVFYFESVSEKLKSIHGEDIPGQEWLARHFNTSALIESALIQRWTLHAIDDQLRTKRFNRVSLVELRTASLAALDEYHRLPPVAYGSAQDLVRDLRESFGLNAQYKSIVAKLKELDSLSLSLEQRSQAARDRLLQVVTVAATALLGLPAAWAFVSVLSEWYESGVLANYQGVGRDQLRSLGEWASNSPVVAALIVYVVSASVILGVILWSLIPIRRPRIPPIVKAQRRPRGYAWPGSPILWSNHDEGEDSTLLEERTAPDDPDTL